MNRPKAASNSLSLETFTCIGLREANVPQACFSDAPTRTLARAIGGVALYPNDLSRRADQSGQKHSYVADSGTQIQDTLAHAYAGLAKKSFRAG